MQAYVDETGCDGRSPVFVFSALLSEAEKWAKFSDEWDICLKQEPSIRYFKTDEATRKNDQFYGFSDSERDDKLKRLCQVINTLQPTEVSCIANMNQFSNSWGRTAGRPLSQPYFFPFQVINFAVAHAIVDMAITEPYEIFFDEQVIFGPPAKAWYPVVKAFAEDSIRAVMPVEPLFRSDFDVLPLQAADLLAWMVRQRKSAERDEFPFSWLDEELSGVKRSRLSTTLGWEPRSKTPEHDPEWQAKRDAALRVYEETFGHEWPPKTKDEMKKMRGKKGV